MFIIGEFWNLFVFAVTVYIRFFLVFIMWGLLFLVNKCFNFGWDCPNLAKFVVNFCLLFSRVSRFNSTIAALYERVGQIIFNASFWHLSRSLLFLSVRLPCHTWQDPSNMTLITCVYICFIVYLSVPKLATLHSFTSMRDEYNLCAEVLDSYLLLVTLENLAITNRILSGTQISFSNFAKVSNTHKLQSKCPQEERAASTK